MKLCQCFSCVTPPRETFLLHKNILNMCRFFLVFFFFIVLFLQQIYTYLFSYLLTEDFKTRCSALFNAIFLSVLRYSSEFGSQVKCEFIGLAICSP